ncbi:MAG TPA: CYTH domain-containing protein [Kribbella sp.]|nr:CYTH domain-containing protein [Kribbella sp.]
MANEYERRFLLSGLPEGEASYEREIRQVYWRLGNGWSLRLRRQGSDFEPDDVVTIKGPRVGAQRPEFEWPLYNVTDSMQVRAASLEAALNLYRAGSAHPVVKTRRGYLIDGQLWDVDEFHHDNEGLIIAELELESHEDLLGVRRPPWTVREVTMEERYNNENLAFEPYRSWAS